jgi:hypothetical protein
MPRVLEGSQGCVHFRMGEAPLFSDTVSMGRVACRAVVCVLHLIKVSLIICVDIDNFALALARSLSL